SVPKLHAKVFVFGSQAFIVSANVSNRSAGTLIEAVVRTTDRGAVASARQFVRDHCLHELGPEELDRLQKLYRPPVVPGGPNRRRTLPKRGPTIDLPRHFIAVLSNDAAPEGSEAFCESGQKAARRRMERPRRHTLNWFWIESRYSYRRGDHITQVYDPGSG